MNLLYHNIYLNLPLIYLLIISLKSIIEFLSSRKRTSTKFAHFPLFALSFVVLLRLLVVCIYGVAIEKSCALFISSFRRWQTKRLEQQLRLLHATSSPEHAFLLRFILISCRSSFDLFLFRVFRSRRVQCQKCEAFFFRSVVVIFSFLACDLHEPFASPKNCWQSLGYPVVFLLSLSLSLALFVLSCGS